MRLAFQDGSMHFKAFKPILGFLEELQRDFNGLQRLSGQYCGDDSRNFSRHSKPFQGVSWHLRAF